MSSSSPLAGLVVAGGYSRRFGTTDKAVARLAGTPMIRLAVDRLWSVVDELVVNCRAEQVPTIRAALEGVEPCRFAVDPVPDRGPVAGIRTGLESVDHAYTAVVACDTPFLDPSLLERLAGLAGGVDGAIVRCAAGHVQPMGAVYRTEAMRRACIDALIHGEPSVVSAIGSLDLETVDEDELDRTALRTFESIDTPRALEAVTIEP
ncbi:molybdenum cofactor guanylyltransferase [Natrarchaeobaculum sulfurireducens]|uniref:Molybdopterin-guanine dinucleotide biosynthesis protein A n=1 Tax=Natrarchaeobaculum sulfurireducens TaxID=2044521 RepID=A0A346PE55_9EURY|nr:molybdenum cofactor guanylyltransferase [Natrarchaeobaculum sulfurireducens]AXR77800.1 Molybdopterin-guanine dinucleotide biosynthesis protein A [Natrarchaeobaculum sulfurireducens]